MPCRLEAEEEDVVSICVQDLSLWSLSKEPSVSSSQMIPCCRRLIEERSPYMKGLHLCVSHFYSVMQDGDLCIPWDWKGWHTLTDVQIQALCVCSCRYAGLRWSCGLCVVCSWMHFGFVMQADGWSARKAKRICERSLCGLFQDVVYLYSKCEHLRSSFISVCCMCRPWAKGSVRVLRVRVTVSVEMQNLKATMTTLLLWLSAT